MHLARITMLAAALISLTAAGLQALPNPTKYAGAYRIEAWEDMEAKEMYHFFFLHPSGEFLLAAKWPGRESSRAAGRWSVEGSHLSLTGRISVETNQGSWKVSFTRTYAISLTEEGIGLHPLPKKNRYGLLGWPDDFIFFRASPSPNLPGEELPRGEEQIKTLIESLGKSLE